MERKLNIETSDVADRLIAAIPEYVAAVREHRADWGDEPMLYQLVGPLFFLAWDAIQDGSEGGRELALRVYDFVDHALQSQDCHVQQVFSIEMIEPLIGSTYGDLEEFLGPAGVKDLEEKREWCRRHPT